MGFRDVGFGLRVWEWGLDSESPSMDLIKPQLSSGCCQEPTTRQEEEEEAEDEYKKKKKKDNKKARTPQ